MIIRRLANSRIVTTRQPRHAGHPRPAFFFGFFDTRYITVFGVSFGPAKRLPRKGGDLPRPVQRIILRR